jgi:hypothetical protein
VTGPGGLLARAQDEAGGVGVGVWAAVVSVVVLAAAGLVGLVLRQPWLFPSLGPTIMVIAETPRQPAAHPRNVLVGHVVGVAAGWLALVVTGLTAAPAVVLQGITAPRVVAACLSLALTALVLQALGTPHPPAGATTLIVSLGVLRTPSQLLAIVLSVLLVTAAATALNLLAGVRQSGVRAARG